MREVIRQLEQTADDGEVPAFKYIELNGMRVTNPRQIYVEIVKVF